MLDQRHVRRRHELHDGLVRVSAAELAQHELDLGAEARFFLVRPEHEPVDELRQQRLEHVGAAALGARAQREDGDVHKGDCGLCDLSGLVAEKEQRSLEERRQLRRQRGAVLEADPGERDHGRGPHVRRARAEGADEDLGQLATAAVLRRVHRAEDRHGVECRERRRARLGVCVLEAEHDLADEGHDDERHGVGRGRVRCADEAAEHAQPPLAAGHVARLQRPVGERGEHLGQAAVRRRKEPALARGLRAEREHQLVGALLHGHVGAVVGDEGPGGAPEHVEGLCVEGGHEGRRGGAERCRLFHGRLRGGLDAVGGFVGAALARGLDGRAAVGDGGEEALYELFEDCVDKRLVRADSQRGHRLDCHVLKRIVVRHLRPLHRRREERRQHAPRRLRHGRARRLAVLRPQRRAALARHAPRRHVVALQQLRELWRQGEDVRLEVRGAGAEERRRAPDQRLGGGDGEHPAEKVVEKKAVQRLAAVARSRVALLQQRNDGGGVGRAEGDSAEDGSDAEAPDRRVKDGRVRLVLDGCSEGAQELLRGGVRPGGADDCGEGGADCVAEGLDDASVLVALPVRLCDEGQRHGGECCRRTPRRQHGERFER
mmetsp:Transcript_24104/g.81271  ORF Transcript_24104/g.81271 Transcript_24104/m.81271 type:complete len:603 (+) Transcript_24104:673-2481(+)